jgi:hypothetical protein
MYTAPQKLHTTITVPGSTKPDDQPSIRQTILGGLVQGLSKDVIKAQVEAIAPDSAGFKKFDRHYAWYKNQARKAGILPQVTK